MITIRYQDLPLQMMSIQYRDLPVRAPRPEARQCQIVARPCAQKAYWCFHFRIVDIVVGQIKAFLSGESVSAKASLGSPCVAYSPDLIRINENPI